MKTIEEKAKRFAKQLVILDNRERYSDESSLRSAEYDSYKSYVAGFKEAFEWISTKNNLPEENLRVLVKLKNGKTDVASLISFPDKNYEDGKRMYWRISISTMYWFDEVEYFRYINLGDYIFLDGSPCGKEAEE